MVWFHTAKQIKELAAAEGPIPGPLTAHCCALALPSFCGKGCALGLQRAEGRARMAENDAFFVCFVLFLERLFFRHGEFPEAASCVARWAAVLTAGDWEGMPSWCTWRSGPFLLPAARYGTNAARDAFAMYVDTSEQAVAVPAAAVAQMSATEGVYKTQGGLVTAEAGVAQTWPF